MANITWPSELPKTLLLNGLSREPQSNVVRTAMDAGPKKARRRYTARVILISGKIVLNESQLKIFERFYSATLADGVLRFNFTDPVTLEMAEFRFTSDYKVGSVDGLFDVSVQMERLQ